MKLLGIDPSSTCTGYAVLTGLAPHELIDAGRIRPSDAKALWDEVPATVRPHWLGKDLAAMRRVESMLTDVSSIIAEHTPDLVIVEIPSGKIGTGAKNRARGSLTTYGYAAGVICERCRWAVSFATPTGFVVPVTERQWTAGQGAKDKRQAAIAAHYCGIYDSSRDTGGDVADAIGLARWGAVLFGEVEPRRAPRTRRKAGEVSHR